MASATARCLSGGLVLGDGLFNRRLNGLEFAISDLDLAQSLGNALVEDRPSRFEGAAIMSGAFQRTAEIVEKIGRTFEKRLEPLARSGQFGHLVLRRVDLGVTGLEFPAGLGEIGIGAAEGGCGRGHLVLGKPAPFDDFSPLDIEGVGLDGMESAEPVLELILQLLEPLRGARLPFDLAEAALDFGDDILEPSEILPGVLEFELSFVLSLLVPGDSSGFLDEDSPVGGSGREHLADPALLDDGVVPGAETDGQEFVRHIHEACDLAVEAVLRGTRAIDPPADLHPAPARRPVAVVGLELDGDLGGAGRGPAAGAVEDHVAHVLQAHERRALFAEDPQQGVDDVRLAAAVGPDDGGHPPRKAELDRIRE